jgi:N-acetylmuramoyl-L-alanine amidase
VPFVGQNSKRNHIFYRPADAVISSIVLHDTIGSLFSTLNKFSDAKEPLLNAHYVVTQRDKNISGGIAIEMVPPEYMAQHAWPSWFGGKDDCNQFSIGIELVGKGFVSHGGKRFFYPYDADQIKTLGPLLQGLVQKYGIRPENIHSHGDVSPQRKYDVTIAFPWKTLYEKYGVGMGLSTNENTEQAIVKKYQPVVPLPQKFDGLFFQKCLSQLGYDTRFAEDASLSSADRGGKWTNVYQAFYGHFSRNGESPRWRGSPDYKDMFWAWALLAKYFQS